jgi:hypothetical protein
LHAAAYWLLDALSAPNITAARSANRSAHTRGRETPGGCRLGARSAPSTSGSGSPTKAFAPPPTDTVPASHWNRCPAERCALLCPSSLAPGGIEGNRSPYRRGASWGVCVGGHEACESVRWRPHGLLQDFGVVYVCSRVDHRERDASTVDHNMALRARLSLIRRVRAGSLAPPGAATLAESKEALSQSIWSASPKRSKSL